jgi:phosphoribosylglycinamide formyltransferase-1
VDVGEKYGVETAIVDGKDAAAMEEELLRLIRSQGVHLLVLAGFMKLLPASVIEVMQGRIINIHPALLPRHGGKGMYGRKVHEAVIASGDHETGATVHWVNERYDEGAVIAQRTIGVRRSDTAEDVERIVRAVERELLPDVVEHLGAIFRSPEQQDLWKSGRVTFSRE